MAGTIFFTEDDAWPASGWLYRWVIEELRKLDLSPQGQEQLDMALQVQFLDLAEFADADRAKIRGALDDSLVQQFTVGLRPGYDPAAAMDSLRELGTLAARTG